MFTINGDCSLYSIVTFLPEGFQTKLQNYLDPTVRNVFTTFNNSKIKAYNSFLVNCVG